MHWLNNFSIRAKFALLAAVLLVALGAIGLAGYHGLQLLRAHVARSDFYLATVRDLLQINAVHNELRAVVLQAVFLSETSDDSMKQALAHELDEQSGSLETHFSDLIALVAHGEIKDALAALQPSFQLHIANARMLVRHSIAGRRKEALQGLPNFDREHKQLVIQQAMLNDMIAAEAARTQALGEEASVQSKYTARLVFLFATFFAVIAVVLISQSVTTPMAQITTAAMKIAQGEIDHDVSYEARDEIGTLAAAFRELSTYIREIVNAADGIRQGNLSIHLQPRSDSDVLSHSFLQMMENLRSMNQQVREGAEMLNVSIAQILTSVQQLTATTTETAAAVTQTATTMEEVKQTAYVSNRKAQDISARSEQTSQVSQAGAHSVEEAIAGMTVVREQMTKITESIVSFSTAMQEIGNIITTVNGLAEQSNILAINAEIEAAKAGETGKGFAVVAQEVRNLAIQSKHATVQVQTILNTIRGAAQAAVQVSELGAQAADLGVQRSLQAGESIRALTKNIAEAAQSVTQIAVSSQQQLIGIDQVATAMENIRTATAHNLTGIKQVDKATRNLQKVNEAMKGVLEQFALTSTPVAGLTPVTPTPVIPVGQRFADSAPL